ncbi:MAG: hypothetical protein AAF937_09430 [Planctomycetota bacterium]
MTAEQGDILIALGDYLAQGVTVGLALAFVMVGWRVCGFFLRERSSLVGRQLD